ncbi:MAG TPA: beta-ketoacyl synthase chain length factor [Xylella sp.]
MNGLNATVEGIGFWYNDLPSWAAACRFVAGAAPQPSPVRPTPQLLAANERRRVSDTVAISLEVALAACMDAEYDPAQLPSVFTSTYGDQEITDYMCTTLANEPLTVSPTKFHNSVHNAAASYWTIGVHALTPTTALSASRASFAQGLLEALVQLAMGTQAVLVVGYDGCTAGPFRSILCSRGLLGGALVLSKTSRPDRLQLQTHFSEGEAPPGTGPLAQHAATNAMAPMLPLFDALASMDTDTALYAGPNQIMHVKLLR